MKTSIARVVLLVSAGLLVWAGCGKDKGNGPVTPKPFNQVIVQFFAVPPPLAGGFDYEMWGKPVDTSVAATTPAWSRLTRFNVDSSGHLVDSNDTVVSDTIRNLPASLDDYDSIQITIEQTNDNHTTASQTVYLRGPVSLTLDTARRITELEFPVPLGSASGFCDLMTPTDSDTSTDLSGVWFVGSDQPGPSDSGLFIPPAPSGWLYEGWVRHRNAWLSTGKFTRAIGPDSANPYSGSIAPPGFPGEDFLRNPPAGIDFAFPFVLTVGDVIKVTMEPHPDPGIGPFGVIVVSVQFANPPVPHALQELAGAPTLVPGAYLTIKRSDGS